MNKSSLLLLKNFWSELLSRNPKWVSLLPSKLLTEKEINNLILSNPRVFSYIKDNDYFVNFYLKSCKINNMYCDTSINSVKLYIDNVIQKPASNIDCMDVLPFLNSSQKNTLYSKLSSYDDFDLELIMDINFKYIDDDCIQFFMETNMNALTNIDKKTIEIIDHRTIDVLDKIVNAFKNVSIDENKINLIRMRNMLYATIFSDDMMFVNNVDWINGDNSPFLIDKYERFTHSFNHLLTSNQKKPLKNEIFEKIEHIKTTHKERFFDKIHSIKTGSSVRLSDDDFL